MQETENLQHYQVPNEMSQNDITPKDQLVYLAIKSFDGKEGCFPSLQKISDKCGASVPTIRSAIDRLKEADYIKVEKKVGANTTLLILIKILNVSVLNFYL